MKLKLLLLSFFVLFFTISCEDDETNTNGTGIVNFSVNELVEIENATSGLGINLGIDNFNHAGGAITVDISGGVYGTDYETTTGGASFTIDVAANSLLATFTLTPIDDDIIEEDKTLLITITSVTGALELGENTTLAFKILDDDDPLIAMVAFQNEVQDIQENEINSTLIEIPFNQASTDGGSITIESSGDAIYGTDYTIDGQTSGNFVLDVTGGAVGANFAVQPIDNAIFEADKTILFTITEVTGGLSIGVISQTTITIVNDDLPPSPLIDFSVSNPTTINEDAGTVTINFDISGTTTEDSTVELTASGVAIVGQDFSFNGDTTNPYSFVIPSGSSSGSFDLVITDDMDFEGNESLILDITSVSGGLDAGAVLQQYTTSLVDNDPDPSAINYLENFETFDESATYLNDVLLYQNALATQTLPNTEIISLVNNTDAFSDETDENLPSSNGLNLFYNSDPDGNGPLPVDPALFGVLDNVVITPVLQGSGTVNVSIDAAWGFRNQNPAIVTFYWSQTYDGSGTFNEGDWTVMGTETADNMNSEGFGGNTYKREQFTINPTANFYIAIRVNQTIDATNYRTRWRFDNIRAVSQ